MVVVERATSGLPVEWSAVNSSEDRNLDHEALSVAESVIENTPADLFVGHPFAHESRWRICAAGYRYGRGDLPSAPGLRPPGRELGHLPILLGETTAVRQV